MELWVGVAELQQEGRDAPVRSPSIHALNAVTCATYASASADVVVMCAMDAPTEALGQAIEFIE